MAADEKTQPLTRADLDRAIQEITSAHRADLDHAIQEIGKAHRADLDRAIEVLAGELSNIHGEIKSRDEHNGRRLDRMADTLRTMDSRLTVMTNWADTLDRATPPSTQPSTNFSGPSPP
jgi:hypothetical protein